MNGQIHPRPGRLLLVPGFALLLCLLFVGPSQFGEAAQDGAPDSTHMPLGAGGAKPDAIDCNNPLPGEWARLIGDDEILVSYRLSDDPRWLRTATINDVSAVLQTPVTHERKDTDSELYEDSWLSAVGADLDGNRKAELVAGYKNRDWDAAAMADPFDSTAWTDYPDWSDTDARNNGNIMDVDVARGNLDPTDAGDEIAMVYRDDYADVHIKVLDGSTTGYIKNADDTESADYVWDQGERGEVRHSMIAVGDMNGDGTDEMAVAFKDSGQDLQVLVVPYKGGNNVNLTPLYQYDSWSALYKYDTIANDCDKYHNKRPLDIDMGDLDGDNQDEIVVAFRGASCNYGRIELMVFDYQPTNSTSTSYNVTYTKFLEFDPDVAFSYQYGAANTISLAVADLDGDGYDEIAMAWNLIANAEHEDRDLYHYVMTFEYFAKLTPDWNANCDHTGPSCLKQRSGSWNAGRRDEPITYDETKHESWTAVAAGDLDQDGMDEVVLGSYNANNASLEVFAFNAENGISSPYSKQVIAGNFWEMALAVGDADGDSRWGQYYNHQCRSRHDVVVNGVVHAPPFWPEGEFGVYSNTYRTAASYGMEIGAGGGNGTSMENAVGASVELNGEAKIEELGDGIKASFTKEWERSISSETEVMTTTVMGTGVETKPPLNADEGEAPNYEVVSTVDTVKWCYDYWEQDLGVTTVCVPQRGATVYNRSGEWWYESGPTAYPNSWVPLGMNLAQGRNATQSSTWTNSTPHGDAWRAADGNTNGDYNQGSVSATNYDQYAWWQVDLGGRQWIDAVELWKRTGCDECDSRLANFYVFVTEEDSFPPADNNDPNKLASDPSVWHAYYSGVASRTTTIPVGEYGRVVRIQLTGTNYLDMAEVKVYGMPGDPKQWPTSKPAGSLASTGGFTLTWPALAQPTTFQQRVDGTLYEVWPDTIGLGIAPGTDDVRFTMGTNHDERDVTASGTSDTYKFGLEIKYKGEVSRRFSEEQSNIATWESDITFEGNANGIEDECAPMEMTYQFHPYIWLQNITSLGGVPQKFLVLDYWTTDDPAVDTCEEREEKIADGEMASARGGTGPGGVGPGGTGPGVAPLAPVIASPTHPDPATWYTNRQATFTWAQPSDDGAMIKTYDFALDKNPSHELSGFHRGLAKTKTYEDLRDGVWTMHVRSMNDAGLWGPTGHRTVRVDATPPKVSITLTPPLPSGEGGWYVTPVTAAVAADDGAGSGIAAVEVSQDGVHWLPYGAALVFNAETPLTTVYARARDAAGNVAAPASASFKIDTTAPDSHIAGGVAPGAWVAELAPNAAGNEQLSLAGSIADALSGRHGIDLKVDGRDWTGPTATGSWHPFVDRPQIEVNWYYTATERIGAGYHIFTGQAFDTAGNREPEYEIARVLWLPKDAPNIGGSSVTALPSSARPGGMVVFTVIARNTGLQEADVAVSDTLPTGLEPVLDRLPPGVVYDPATRTVTWPVRLLWPGQWVRHELLARIDASLGLTRLENRATFHAFWPNTDLLPPSDRQKFLDKEQTVVARTTVTVDPRLMAGADVTAPWAILSQPLYQQAHAPEVKLHIVAPADVRQMYVREWSPDPLTGDWIVRQNSGWIEYDSPYTWTLSSGQGVKYLGAWLKDGAGNVSTLSEASLIFVNRIDGNQALADGERVQYRGILFGGERLQGYFKTAAGDPDLYVWQPRNVGWPDYGAVETVLPGQVETFSRQFGREAGRLLVEVQGVGASEYSLTLSSPHEPIAGATAAGVGAAKPRPEHPLTVSDPLSAGQVGPSVTAGKTLYLPVIFLGE